MVDPSLLGNAAIAGDGWLWVVIALWVFAVGASIGSFLNVVIYRVPAGLSIAHPPSHCPRCKHRIRAYDNIPVVSYLLLRGRCRDCGIKFSPRYAIIEFVAGLILVLIAATSRMLQDAFFAKPHRTDALIGLGGEVAFLAVMLASLWSATMIARDGHRPPWKLIVLPLVVGLVCAPIWPELIAVPIGAVAFPSLSTIDPRLTGIAGAVSGAAAVAMWLAIAFPRKGGLTADERCPAIWIIAWSGVVGLFVGWQLALAISAVTAVCMALAHVAVLPKRPRSKNMNCGWLSRYAIAVTLGVFCRNVWPAIETRFGDYWMLVAAGAILVAAVVARVLAPRTAVQA